MRWFVSELPDTANVAFVRELRGLSLAEPIKVTCSGVHREARGQPELGCQGETGAQQVQGASWSGTSSLK